MVETSPLVNITSAALKELKRLVKDQPEDNNLFRIGVKGGGCSGLTYIIDFGQQEVQDYVFDYDGLKVIVNQAHALYLQGVVLEFEEGLNNRGFSFSNPNAKETCGCGTSFSV